MGFAAEPAKKSLAESFTSSDLAQQRALLATFDRTSLTTVERGQLQEVLALATRSASVEVRSEALAVIARLVPYDVPAAARLAHPDFLADLVIRGDSKVSQSAVELALTFDRDGRQVLEAAERRLRNLPIEPDPDSRLVHVLSARGMISDALADQLAEWAQTREDALAFESVVALAKLNALPAAADSWILRIASTKAFFAHPDLIALLEGLRPLDAVNMQRLLALKARFDREVAKSVLDRDVSIYNDGLYRSVLDRVISEVTADL